MKRNKKLCVRIEEDLHYLLKTKAGKVPLSAYIRLLIVKDVKITDWQDLPDVEKIGWRSG